MGLDSDTTPLDIGALTTHPDAKLPYDAPGGPRATGHKRPVANDSYGDV